MKLLPLYILLFSVQYCNAESRRIDSLRTAADHTANAAARLPIIFSICEESNGMSNRDAMYYGAMALKLSRQIQDADTAEAYYYYAFAQQKNGTPDSALQITDRQLQQLEQQKRAEERVYRRFLHLKGTLMVRKEQYKDGIAAFYKLLNNSERNKDTLYQLIAKRGLGWVYMEINNYPQALRWSHEALHTDRYGTNEKEHAVVYSNMAAMFNNTNRFDSAEYYGKQAIRIARKYNNLVALANALNIQVGYLMATNRNPQAEQSLKDALEIRSIIGDPYYIVSDMGQMAEYYELTNEPAKSITLTRQAIDTAVKYNISAKLPFLYKLLARAYKASGDLNNYSTTLERLISLNDSLYKKNTADALAEIQAKYDVQKKNNIIIRQQFELTRQNYLLYGTTLLALLVILFSIILFRNFRKKQKLRMAYLLATEKQQSYQAVREAEENERKRIAADLHDSLGVYAASIASNIEHIKYHNPGANDNTLQELSANSQAIVSQLSDTIWALKKDSLSLTDISDRLKIFIQRVQRSYNSIHIDVHENIIRDIQLSPSQAFHLFCIMQEAVTNALKHSDGNQITVDIQSDVSWQVTVSDNGRGMETTGNKDGNGLFNMRRRATESGWAISWARGDNSGTVVKISPHPTTN